MTCCGQNAVIKVERAPTVINNNPKIVRTVKYLSPKSVVKHSAIKPFNDREKHRI